MEDNNQKQTKVTISDLAKASGYSKTAVSFAFNDPGRISSQAYAIIMETAKKIGYIPNPMARNLSLQRHQSIGLLLPDRIDEVMLNPYISEIIQGIGRACEESEYSLTMLPLLHGSIDDAVRSAAVDGLITLGMQAEMNVVGLMRLRKIPFVTIDGTVSAEMPGVIIDDEAAAYDQLKYILQAGYRKITLLTMPFSEEDSVPARRNITVMRMNGYRRALREFGLSLEDEGVSYIQAECTRDEGRRAAAEILSSGERPSAVVCMSDVTAIGCMLEFHDRGITIPDEIAVIGFDGIDAGEIVAPPLTTLSQPGREKGRAAAALLIDLIGREGTDEFRIVLPHNLIRRGSV